MSDLGSGWFGRKRAASRVDSKLADAKLPVTRARPRRPGIMALEPRIMYDAAAAATIGAAQAHNDGAPDHAALSAAEQHAPPVTPGNSGAPDAHASPTQQQSLAQAPNVPTAAPPPAMPEDVRTTSALDASHASAPTGGVHEIVVVDSRVPNVRELLGGLKPGTQTFVLDPDRDGLQQIADIIETNHLHDLDAVQIVSHGLEGEVRLGSTTLTDSNLAQYSAQLGRIGEALTPGGDILLYGCNVGHGAAGQQFIDDLSAYTGADVAASTDPVGATPTGFDWSLDVTTGPIKATNPFSVQTLASYDATLANPLTGQLWYLTQGNTQGATTDVSLAHVNSDGGNSGVLVSGPAFPTYAPADVQIDTAAGLYYVISNGGDGSNAKLLMGHIGSNAAPTALATFIPDSMVNTLQIDPVTHHLYVGEQDAVGTATLEGIRDYTYNPTTGAVTPVTGNGGWLVRGDQQSGIAIENIPDFGNVTPFDPRDFALDRTTNTLFFVNEEDGSVFVNQIYKIDLDNPLVVTPLLQQSQFPPNSSGSFPNGYLTSVDVDSNTGLVYFTTHSQYPSPDAAYNATLNRIYWIPETANGSTAATALTITGLPAGNTFYPGKITIDLQSRQIYVASEDRGDSTGTDVHSADDVIYVLQLDASGHTASFVQAIHPSPAFAFDASNIGGMAFNALPDLTLAGTGTHAMEQGGYVDLTSSSTSTDVDGGYYSGATVQITGGTFASGETSASDDHLTVLDGAAHRSSGVVSGTNIAVSYNSATETLTLSGYDTVANYNAVLGNVQYNATGDNPTSFGANTTRTISWTVSDGTQNIPFGAQNSGQTTLTIDAVNDAPTVTAPSAHYAAIEKADLSLRNTGLSVADVDAGTGIETATLSVGEGKITIGVGDSGASIVSGNGTNSVVFSGTLAQINALLNTSTGTIVYNDPSDTPAASTLLTLSVNDGGNSGGSAQSGSKAATIDITSLNSPPVVSGFSNPVTPVTELLDASAQDIPALTGTLTVTDTDPGDSLTASVAGNAVAKLNGSAANIPGGVDLSALVAASAMGFASATSDGTAQTLTWTYNPTSANLDFLMAGDTLTIEYIARVSDDGNAHTYGSQILTITIQGTNDAPTTSAHTLAAVEDTSYVLKAADFPFADAADGAGNALANIIITSLPANGTLSYNGVALTAGDVAPGYSIAAGNIGLLTFLAAGNANGAAYASFSFKVQDNGGVADGGQDTSAAATMTIDVAAVNDVPVIAVVPGGNSSVTEAGGVANATPGNPDAAGQITITDPDTGESHFQAPPTLVGAYGTFTFDTTSGAWTYLLDQTKADPLTAGQHITDTLTVTSADGSATHDIVVTITGSNDAASFGGAATGAVVEDTTTATGGILTVIDVDAGQPGFGAGTSALVATYGTFTFLPASGAWTYTLDHTKSDSLVGAQVVADRLTVHSADGTSQDIVVTITGTNDAPVATGLAAPLSVLEQTMLNLKTRGLAVSDVDGNTGLQTVTLSVNEGVLAATAGLSGASVTASPDNRTLTIIGTLAQINALLSSDGTSTVSYIDNTDTPGASDSLTLTIKDGGNATGSATSTITLVPVNDAPTVTLPVAGYSATERTLLALSGTGLAIGDVDAGNGSVTVTLSVGEGVLTSGSSLVFSGSGSSTLVLKGTVTQINALLGLAGNAAGAISYIDNADRPSNSTVLTLSVDDNGNTGDGALTASDSRTISIARANDVPVGINDTFDVGANPVSGGGSLIVPVAFGLLSNDRDPDGDALTVASVAKSGGASFSLGVATALTYGTITVSANGGFTYTPTAGGAAGTDTFTYVLSDGTGLSSAVTVTLNVIPNASGVAPADVIWTTARSLAIPSEAPLSVYDTGVLKIGTDGSRTWVYQNTTTTATGVTSPIARPSNIVVDVANNLYYLLATPSTATGRTTGDVYMGHLDSTAAPILVYSNPDERAYDGSNIDDIAIDPTTRTLYISQRVNWETGSQADNGIFAYTYNAATGALGAATAIVTVSPRYSDTLVGHQISYMTPTPINGFLYYAQVDYTTWVGTYQLHKVNVTTHVDTIVSTPGWSITPLDYHTQYGTYVNDIVYNSANNELYVVTYDQIANSNSRFYKLYMVDPNGGVTPSAVTISGLQGSITGEIAYNSANGYFYMTNNTQSLNAYSVSSDGRTLTYSSAVSINLSGTLQPPSAGPGYVFNGVATDQPASMFFTPGNKAPTNTMASSSFSATEQVPLSLKATGVAALSIADPDGGASIETVKLKVGEGVLNVTAGGSGATVFSGNGTAEVTLKGTIAQINALLSTDANSTVTYTANSDAPSAHTTLTFSVTDAGNLTATDVATIFIAAVNDAPTAAIGPVSYNASEQTSLSLKNNGLVVGDPDAGANGIVTVTLSVGSGVLNVTAGSSGVGVSGSGTGTVTLTGKIGQINNLLTSDGTSTVGYFNASDTPIASTTLTLTVNDNGNTGDGGAKSASDTATINIAAVNDAPVARDDVYSGVQNGTINGGSVLANDSDVDTAPGLLQAVVVNGPGHAGSFTLQADGTFTYTPVSGFSGSDYFTYKVVGGGPDSNVVTVTLNIASSPLHAVNDSFTGAAGATEDTLLAVSATDGVLKNDFRDGGGGFTAVVVDSTSHGTLALAADGSFTYTPDANFYGSDSFTYRIVDGVNAPALATVTIDVVAVNDAPVFAPSSPSVVTYVENAAATPLFASEAITDADQPADFNHATLRIEITSPASAVAEDQLVLLTASGFKIDGGLLIDMLNGNAQIGTATASDSLVLVQFGPLATPAMVNRVVAAFGFMNAGYNPGSADRVVTMTFNDGGNVGAGTPVDVSVTQTVHVTPVADPPQVTAGHSVGYSEQAAAVVIDGAITVTDVDSPTLTRATVTITDYVNGDVLAAPPGTNVISNVNGVLVLELIGATSPDDYQAVLQGVTFASSSDDPTVGGTHTTRQIAWVVTDDTGQSNLAANSTITVTADNDAPSIAAPGGLRVEPSAAVLLTGITFADPDGSGLPEQVTFSAPSGAFTASSGLGVTVSGTPLSTVLTGSIDALNAFIAGGRISFTPVTADPVTVTVDIDDLSHTGTPAKTATASIVVTGNFPPAVPVDSDGTANAVQEGAVAGTAVGITAQAFDPDAVGVNPVDTITYSLVGHSSTAFQIDAVTGEVTVRDASLIDYESNPSHATTITVQASDGHNISTADFVVAITDRAPSDPVDVSGASDGTVSENASNGDLVGITASASDVNGGTITYSLTSDAGGRFQINSNTGVVAVANAALLDYESATFHSITVQASDGTLTSSQNFTIAVTDVAPSTPLDTEGATGGTVSESAANGDLVGITASSSDVHGGTVTYSLSDTAGGRFAINSSTGVVSVANASLLDFETATSHSITIRAADPRGLFTEQTFTIAVTDVAPTAPVDADLPTDGSVSEGASNGDFVGITASSSDVNGGTVTYSLTDNAGGRFAIDAATGVVSVANASLLDFESATTHSIVVRAEDANHLFTETSLTIAVTDVAPTQPVDGNAAGDTVIEGAASGTLTGITGVSADIHGGTVTYSLSADASNGGFAIDSATGVVTIADAARIDFESSGGSYAITIRAADPAGAFTEQTFIIAVTDVAPSTPVDNDGAVGGSVSEAAVNGAAAGIAIASTDINGGAVTLSLSDDAGGRFAIDAAGLVSVADASLLDFETATSHVITVRAVDPSGAFTEQSFTIAVTDVAPTAPVDGNAATDSVSEGAVAGDLVGIAATSSDVHGGQVIYSLTDSAGGRFAIDAGTGVIRVANASLLDFETDTSHSIVVRAADPDGLFTETSFTIAVTNVAPSQPVDADAAVNTVVEGAANGTVIGITGASTDVHGGMVTYSLSADSSHGGFAIDSATGVVTVADASRIDFESSGGSHTITVRASDPAGAFTEQTFTIAVTDVAPVATGEAFATDEDTSLVAGAAHGLLANDADINGAPLTAVLNAGPAHGTLTLNADGSFSYLSFRDYNGADSFTYHVSDGTLTSAIVTVNLTINAVNDAPVLIAGNTLSFDANAGRTILLSPGILLFDVDSATMSGARVAITGGYEPADDTLGFVDRNGITGSFDRATGVLTLTGTASVADYQAALASVTFISTTFVDGSRTVQWTIDDGSAQFSQSVVTQTAVGVSGIILPPPVFADKPGVTPTQVGAPSPLGFDTTRVNLLGPDERADGYGGSSVGYGYQPVTTRPVLTSGADADVQIDLALAGLRDALGGDVIYIIALQANGDPLPDWLSFDPATGRFAGLPPDGMVASLQNGDYIANDVQTGALPPDPGVGTAPSAVPPARTITVEVLARDSRGNLAVTTFVIELRPRGGKQGWYMLPDDVERHAALPVSPELAAIDAAVRDLTGRDTAAVIEPLAIRGLPSRHGEPILIGAADAFPAGRAGLSEQMAGIGWRAMAAQRNALLASLQQDR